MNRPLNFSPSRSFSFAPSEAPAASWSVPPRLPVIRECVYRVARFHACPPAFLFIGPQVRFECKMRKKVPRRAPFVRRPLLFSRRCLATRRPLRNHSSPRSGLHTSSTERVGQIWTASLSFSLFVPGRLFLSLFRSPSSPSRVRVSPRVHHR